MGQIGEAISTSVPAVGTAGTTYASDINTLLEEFKTRLTQKVPLSSIDGTLSTSSSLDMNNQPVKSAQYLGMYPQSGAPSGTPYGRLESYAGNLYYVDSSGAVQITVGGSLNASGIGGIVGDYGGVNPAKVTFVNASERYEFYDDMSLTQWAIIKSRQLELVDEASTRVVTIKPSASIAASYSFTLPPNDPAAGVSLLTLNSTGDVQLAESAPVTNAFSVGAVATFTADPVLSGATKIKHGNRTLSLPAHVDHGASVADAIYGVTATGGGGIFRRRIAALRVGERIVSVTARVNKPGTGATAMVLKYTDSSGVAQTVAGAGGTSTASGVQSITYTPTVPYPIAAISFPYIEYDVGDAAEDIYGFDVVYDQN